MGAEETHPNTPHQGFREGERDAAMSARRRPSAAPPASPTDPLSTFLDRLANALAARLDFPPRASSAASALAAPARATPPGARRKPARTPVAKEKVKTRGVKRATRRRA
jgi:hypothetical protein